MGFLEMLMPTGCRYEGTLRLLLEANAREPLSLRTGITGIYEELQIKCSSDCVVENTVTAEQSLL